MKKIEILTEILKTEFEAFSPEIKCSHGEITLELPAQSLIQACILLRDHQQLHFEILLDICGVDYSTYGVSDWATQDTTATGFCRGVEKSNASTWTKPRFAVVYHLLSLKHNHRLRLRVFPEGEPPTIASVNTIWNSANWFEREAYDLFGIVFKDHPDLRRILTDYGFVGHPFRKDFPLIGNVEVRYDAAQKRVIYEPVSIDPRTLVPRVVRDDNRYIEPENAIKQDTK
ncbi:MAG: NADH-quinone oxidoreductase subunit C [Gammaproteobacteria bacterium]